MLHDVSSGRCVVERVRGLSGSLGVAHAAAFAGNTELLVLATTDNALQVTVPLHSSFVRVLFVSRTSSRAHSLRTVLHGTVTRSTCLKCAFFSFSFLLFSAHECVKPSSRRSSAHARDFFVTFCHDKVVDLARPAVLATITVGCGGEGASGSCLLSVSHDGQWAAVSFGREVHILGTSRACVVSCVVYNENVVKHVKCVGSVVKHVNVHPKRHFVFQSKSSFYIFFPPLPCSCSRARVTTM